MDSKIKSVLSNLRNSPGRRLERNPASNSENKPSSTGRPTNRNADRPAQPNRPIRRTDTTLLDIHDRFDLPKPADPPFGGRTGPVAIPINPNAPGADNFIPPHEYYEHIKEQRGGNIPTPINVDDIGVDIFPEDWGQVIWEEPQVFIHPDRAREWAE